MANFAEVLLNVRDIGHCPVCGKSSIRSQSFKGSPSFSDVDREVIWERVKEAADNWKPDFTHRSCMEDQTYRRMGRPITVYPTIAEN